MNTQKSSSLEKETKVCRYCQREVPLKAKKCPECHSNLRNWFARHPILTLLVSIPFIGGIISGFSGSTPTDLSRCLPVPEAALNGLVTGIEDGVTVRGAQAVRSGDHPSAYYVAVDLEGPGLGDTTEIALFATNRGIEDKDTAGFFAVNEVANEFSDWGESKDTDFALTQFGDGAGEAKQCTRAVLGDD